MNKQYTCNRVYSDNYEIATYVDGVENNRDIVALWEMDAYLRRLTDDGYTEAYDEETINAYKEEYEDAKYLYELAKANPLCKG